MCRFIYIYIYMYIYTQRLMENQSGRKKAFVNTIFFQPSSVTETNMTWEMKALMQTNYSKR